MQNDAPANARLITQENIKGNQKVMERTIVLKDLGHIPTEMDEAITLCGGCTLLIR